MDIKTLVYLNLTLNVLTIKVVIGYLIYTNNRLEVKLGRTFWFKMPYSIKFVWWDLPFKKARANSGKVILEIPLRNHLNAVNKDTEMFHEKRRKDREHKESLQSA